MRKEEFQAISSHNFRDSRIDSNLSLFIFGTDTVTNTVLTELLIKEMQDKDRRFCVASSEYNALNQTLPEIARDGRVNLVYVDSYEFIRMMSIAGRIFTIWFLPNYFIKKEGQVIYCVSSNRRLREMSAAKIRIQNYARTINNTDYFIKDDFYEKMCISTHHNEEWMSVLLPSAHYNPKREIKILTDVKGFNKRGHVRYGISSAAWDYCIKSGRYESDFLKNVYPFTHSLKNIFESSSVIVSANENAINIAKRSGKECVFYGRKRGKLSESIINCFDIYEAIDEGYRLLSARRRFVADESSAYDCDVGNVTMSDFVPARGNAIEKRILVMAAWSDRNKYVYLEHFLRKVLGRDEPIFDILFSPIVIRNMTAEEEESISDMNVMSLNGTYQCISEEHEDIKKGTNHHVFKIGDITREWKRILGDVHYDEILIAEGFKLPRQEMYECMPTKNSSTLSEEDLATSLLELLRQSPEIENLTNEARLCNIDGEEFMFLGNMRGKEQYINRRIISRPYVLVKYRDEFAQEIHRALANYPDKDSAVIVVGLSAGKSVDIAGRRTTTIFPVEFAAPELIESCELLIASHDDAECAVAKALSVPVQTLDSERVE